MIVCLISGVDYCGGYSHRNLGCYIFDGFVGVLSCLDGYMNIALEQTEEHVNGAVTNRYGDAFIRGNNGTSLFLLFVSSGPFYYSITISWLI